MHREKLLEIIPEFNSIQDEKLRAKSVGAMEDAMQLGGWTIDDLDEIPFTLLIPDCPVSFLTHTRTVTQVAIKTAELMKETYARFYNIDMDLLICGAILHDMGKLLEYRRDDGVYRKSKSGTLLRHPFSGAGLATKHDLPEEVVHIIATHAKEGDGGYRTPESVIVHHADFINFEPLRNESK
jgi:putative nucleotidyltransferase with HDIG domain